MSDALAIAHEVAAEFGIEPCDLVGAERLRWLAMARAAYARALRNRLGWTWVAISERIGWSCPCAARRAVAALTERLEEHRG